MLEDEDRGEAQEDEIGVCMEVEESCGRQGDDMAGQCDGVFCFEGATDDTHIRSHLGPCSVMCAH